MNREILICLLATFFLPTISRAEAQLIKVTIGNNAISGNGLPAWMAKEAGYFARMASMSRSFISEEERSQPWPW